MLSRSIHKISEHITNPELELCCGMLDGSIQIWTFASLLLSNSNSNEKIIKVSLTPHPIMSPSPSKIYVDLSITESIGSTSAINSIKYCPFNTDIFLTAGMDGYIRIWHVDDKLHPLFTRYLKGDIKDVQWDPNGLSIIAVYTFLSF
jgi:WD40 repeat protein